MKYMTMKKKLYSFNLQLFADDNGGGDGDDSGDDGDDQDDDDSDEDGEEEKKYSQKDIDEAVKKRLAREKRKWDRKQSTPPKDDGEKDKDSTQNESEDAKARKDAESKATSLEVKVACYEAGVSKDAVDDVTALARAYMAADEDLDLEDAIEKVVKKYPQFKKGAADPDGEEEEDETKNKAWGQRQKGKGSKKTDGVEAAFLKKNPGLKVD